MKGATFSPKNCEKITKLCPFFFTKTVHLEPRKKGEIFENQGEKYLWQPKSLNQKHKPKIWKFLGTWLVCGRLCLEEKEKKKI